MYTCEYYLWFVLVFISTWSLSWFKSKLSSVGLWTVCSAQDTSKNDRLTLRLFHCYGKSHGFCLRQTIYSSGKWIICGWYNSHDIPIEHDNSHDNSQRVLGYTVHMIISTYVSSVRHMKHCTSSNNDERFTHEHVNSPECGSKGAQHVKLGM